MMLASTLAGFAFSNSLEALCQDLSIPTLRQFGVGESEYFAQIPQMVEEAIRSGSPGQNPVVPSADEMAMLYRQLYAS